MMAGVRKITGAGALGDSFADFVSVALMIVATVVAIVWALSGFVVSDEIVTLSKRAPGP